MPPRKIILGDRILGGIPKEEPEPDPKTVQNDQTITEYTATFTRDADGVLLRLTQTTAALSHAIAQAAAANQPQSAEEKASTPNTGWLWQSMRRLFIGVDSSRD